MSRVMKTDNRKITKFSETEKIVYNDVVDANLACGFSYSHQT